MRVVIALGGNAFSRAGEPITQEVHLLRVKKAAEIISLIKRATKWLLPTATAPRWVFWLSYRKA